MVRLGVNDGKIERWRALAANRRSYETYRMRRKKASWRYDMNVNMANAIIEVS
jgi:hypothetical protein